MVNRHIDSGIEERVGLWLFGVRLGQHCSDDLRQITWVQSWLLAHRPVCLGQTTFCDQQRGPSLHRQLGGENGCLR